MNPFRLLFAICLAVLICVRPKELRADERLWRAPGRIEPLPRLFLGANLGLFRESSVRAGGRSLATGGREYAGLHAGIAGALTKDLAWLALGRMAKFGDWELPRTRLDLALGPEFRIGLNEHWPRTGMRVALPIGPSWTFISDWQGRLVHQDYSVGRGVHFGLTLGWDFSHARQGADIQIGWLMYMTRFERTMSIEGVPSQEIREPYRTVDQIVMLTVGYMYLL